MRVDSSTRVNYNHALVRVSSPVLKRRLDRNEGGDVVPYEELQLRVENIFNHSLADLEVQVEYVAADGRFLGMDSDLYAGQLRKGQSWIATFLLDIPKDSASANIEIQCRPHRIHDRVAAALRNPFILIPLLLLTIILTIGKRGC